MVVLAHFRVESHWYHSHNRVVPVCIFPGIDTAMFLQPTFPTPPVVSRYLGQSNMISDFRCIFTLFCPMFNLLSSPSLWIFWQSGDSGYAGGLGM